MTFSPVWDSQRAIKRKNARMFQRLATGNQIAKYREAETRIITLTSSREKRFYRNRKGEIVERTIRQSWQNLRNRIKRATIEKDGFRGFNLNKYYAVRTSEGNGVYHIPFWGGNFIPQKWLSKTWEKIHGATIVYIQKVEKKTVAGLTGYLLDRYLTNQPIERISYGWGWAWLGFCKSWENVKLTYNNMRKGSLTYNAAGQVEWDQEHIVDSSMRRLEQREVINYVPFKKRVSHKALCAWKRHLATKRVTSRQIKFFYPNRGWQTERFNLVFNP